MKRIILAALFGVLVYVAVTLGSSLALAAGNKKNPVAGHKDVLPGCLSSPPIISRRTGKPLCGPLGPKFLDAPIYQGIVKPITSPIVMQYRPFPKSTFTLKERFVTETKIIKETLKSGTYQGQPIADGILLTMTINEGPGRENMALKAVFKISGKGKFNRVESVEVSVGDQISSEASDSEIRSLRESLEIAFRQGFPRFSDKGVVVGDTLYDNTFNLLGVHISRKSFVRGLTVHNGRDALFTVYGGSLSTKTSIGLMNGYSLFDLATGVQFLAEGIILMPVPVEGKIATATIFGKNQINLPPIHGTQGDGSIEERLTKLKELLDKGLVTPEDAAAKRKEILNSL